MILNYFWAKSKFWKFLPRWSQSAPKWHRKISSAPKLFYWPIGLEMFHTWFWTTFERKVNFENFCPGEVRVHQNDIEKFHKKVLVHSKFFYVILVHSDFTWPKFSNFSFRSKVAQIICGTFPNQWANKKVLVHSKFFYVILVHSDFTWAKMFKIYFSLKSSSKSFVEHFQTNGPIKKFWCTRNFSMSFWCTLTSPGQKFSKFTFRSKVVRNHLWNISKPMGQ